MPLELNLPHVPNHTDLTSSCIRFLWECNLVRWWSDTKVLTINTVLSQLVVGSCAWIVRWLVDIHRIYTVGNDCIWLGKYTHRKHNLLRYLTEELIVLPLPSVVDSIDVLQWLIVQPFNRKFNSVCKILRSAIKSDDDFASLDEIGCANCFICNWAQTTVLLMLTFLIFIIQRWSKPKLKKKRNKKVPISVMLIVVQVFIRGRIGQKKSIKHGLTPLPTGLVSLFWRSIDTVRQRK